MIQRPEASAPSIHGRSGARLFAADRSVFLLGGVNDTGTRTITYGGLWTLGTLGKPVLTGR